MIYPLFAMFLLTLIIGLYAFKVRYQSVMTGDVKLKYFRIMEGQEVSQLLKQTTRCFNNQFEVPVLFYVVGVLLVTLHLETQFSLLFAWLFIGFRIIHATVMMTYNNVLHRMIAFWGSFLSVLVLWLQLLLNA